MDWRGLLPLLLVGGLVLALAIPHFRLLNNYVQLVLIYVGINIILATSLNLVNGYMGEFSLAHAGFMAVGAYSSALLSMKVLPVAAHPALFHLALQRHLAFALRGKVV
jgi:branched-chain amino acid transport system permease protein